MESEDIDERKESKEIGYREEIADREAIDDREDKVDCPVVTAQY